MKGSIIVAAVLAGTLAAPIVTAHDKGVHNKPGMSMDMDNHMSQMQENMKAMQQQMDKIRATSDPTERPKLMQEHMQAMQENMKAMRGMDGTMMMGSGKPGDKAMGGHEHKAGAAMMGHHGRMERRMDMMQMMMEQMMQHDQAMQSMPAK